MTNCEGCKKKLERDPSKDLRELSEGFYVVSKVYVTALNPEGVIVGPFSNKETAESEYKKFVFLKRLINPKIIYIAHKTI